MALGAGAGPRSLERCHQVLVGFHQNGFQMTNFKNSSSSSFRLSLLPPQPPPICRSRYAAADMQGARMRAARGPHEA